MTELLGRMSQWAAQHGIDAVCELRDARLGYRIIQTGDTASFPFVEWGLAVGEYIHNVRSALDNLAFALARLKMDPPTRPNAVTFPIYRDKDAFQKNGRRNIDQMPEAVTALIERIQPFQRDGGPTEGIAENDPLLQLQWLSNTDKHRVPAVVLIAPQTLSHNHQIEFRSEEEAVANAPPDVTLWNGALAPGVVLFEMRTRHPLVSVKGTTEVHGHVAIETSTTLMPADLLLPAVGQYTS